MHPKILELTNSAFVSNSNTHFEKLFKVLQRQVDSQEEGTAQHEQVLLEN